jgi:AcrR family transcriptional regulator
MQKCYSSTTIEKTASRPRGRPRAFDREAALEQATRLFWTKGYEATSMADLTQAMGIGSPSLYAAFGSKEALYTEALRHYAETNEHLVWAAFQSADTARGAVMSFLMDSAAALTGCIADLPRGCMVTLSSVGSEGHTELGEIVRNARAVTLERLKARLAQAVADGEIAESTDLHALARFVQAVQTGMSILARDGASRSELEDMTEVAMSGWDARIPFPDKGTAN